jgi:bifunctional DNA primase/polymerase-like protein
MTSLGDAAIAYAASGWAVFPCDLDKRPLVRGGFHAATRDADVIRRSWTGRPEASIGAPVPDVFAVLDMDEDGPATLAALEAVYSRLPVTLTVRTGGGGQHLYFRHPGGALRQGAGLLGPGLDTRMPGRGYTILPPSPHRSGRRYGWVDPTTPAAVMPVWLTKLLRPPSPPPVPVRVPSGRNVDRYVAAAVDGEIANVLNAPVGTRNKALHLAASKLGTLIGGGVLDEAEVIASLLDAARTSGYIASDGERPALSTIRSGLAWGQRHPREVRR